MRSNFGIIGFAIAVLGFTALPLAAQMPPAPHPAAPSHSASVPHSGNWAGGRQMTTNPPNNNNHGGNNQHNQQSRRRGEGRRNGYGSGYGYGAYGAPYEIPADNEYDQLEGHGMLDHPQAEEAPDNRVGPTIFEHNGQPGNAAPESRTRNQSYRPESSFEEPAAASSLDDSPNPAVLVFRDGHRQEISNYAIAGTQLIVLGSKTQKIPISELDLNATSKANADRGIDFKMPQS